MDNSEAASTTQLDSGDIAAAVDVPKHLESGEPNIIALALAIHNHQEALKRGATATSANAAIEVPQEAQEALKNKTKRLADDTNVAE